MKKIFILLLIAVAGLRLQAQPLSPTTADKGNVLIKNGTVITVTKGTLEGTDVLVTNGKIAQIAKNIAAPSGTKVIDATGMYVMPGIIDAHSHAGLSAINEGTNAITPEVFTGDVVNPFDVGIYRALAGGVTAS